MSAAAITDPRQVRPAIERALSRDRGRLLGLLAKWQARPKDADLRAAIELAQRIKMEGRRRQLQLIGKMLRQRDVEPIRQALDKLKNRHNQQVVLFHKLENLRDRLIDQGDDAIAEVLNLWPDADRQQLRTLIRNAKKEKEGNKPPKSARQIFQYLRELAENEG